MQIDKQRIAVRIKQEFGLSCRLNEPRILIEAVSEEPELKKLGFRRADPEEIALKQKLNPIFRNKIYGIGPIFTNQIGEHRPGYKYEITTKGEFVKIPDNDTSTASRDAIWLYPGDYPVYAELVGGGSISFEARGLAPLIFWVALVVPESIETITLTHKDKVDNESESVFYMWPRNSILKQIRCFLRE